MHMIIRFVHTAIKFFPLPFHPHNFAFFIVGVLVYILKNTALRLHNLMKQPISGMQWKSLVEILLSFNSCQIYIFMFSSTATVYSTTLDHACIIYASFRSSLLIFELFPWRIIDKLIWKWPHILLIHQVLSMISPFQDDTYLYYMRFK